MKKIEKVSFKRRKS